MNKIKIKLKFNIVFQEKKQLIIIKMIGDPYNWNPLQARNFLNKIFETIKKIRKLKKIMTTIKIFWVKHKYLEIVPESFGLTLLIQHKNQ